MKYMGSKSRLVKDLKPIIEKYIKENNIDTYIEPFVGGANMIKEIECKNKIGYDLNNYLIALLNAIKDGKEFSSEITKEKYLDIKENKDKYEDWYVGLVGICGSFKGKWFGGLAHITKTKKGIRNYFDEAIKNVNKDRQKMNDITFVTEDYKNLEFENVLIYCDPPYKGTTDYSFKKGFDHDKFWEWARKMSKNNIVLISEYDAPEDFECIFEKPIKTNLSSVKSFNSCEKLFVLKK